MLGSAITTVVLPLVVFDATGSVTQTGALFAVRVVPYLLFGVIAGPLADRGNRRFLIIGGNVAEGLLVATIPLAHVLGVLTVAQVYVVGLLSATAFVFSDAAVFGAVPALVGPDRLSRANGFLYAQASAAEVAGPVVGGLLVGGHRTGQRRLGRCRQLPVAAGCQMTIKSTFRTTPAASGVGVGDPRAGWTGAALRTIRPHRGHPHRRRLRQLVLLRRCARPAGALRGDGARAGRS